LGNLFYTTCFFGVYELTEIWIRAKFDESLSKKVAKKVIKEEKNWLKNKKRKQKKKAKSNQKILKYRLYLI